MTKLMKLVMGMALCVVMVGAPGKGKAQTSPTVKDDLFAGTEMFAKGATSVTEISMDPDSLGMVGGRDSRRAHSMVLNVVRTYGYDKPGMYRIEDVETFRNKLNTGDWHCSVHIRDMKNGESTDVCRKRRTDDLEETAIVTVEKQELTFIHRIQRRSADGKSEMGDFMMFGGFSGLPALARLEPQLMGLNIELQNMSIPNEAEIQAQVNAALAGAHMNGADMERRMAEAQRAMGEAQKQMKNFKMPEIKQDFKFEFKQDEKLDKNDKVEKKSDKAEKGDKQ